MDKAKEHFTLVKHHHLNIETMIFMHMKYDHDLLCSRIVIFFKAENTD